MRRTNGTELGRRLVPNPSVSQRAAEVADTNDFVTAQGAN